MILISRKVLLTTRIWIFCFLNLRSIWGNFLAWHIMIGTVPLPLLLLLGVVFWLTDIFSWSWVFVVFVCDGKETLGFRQRWKACIVFLHFVFVVLHFLSESLMYPMTPLHRRSRQLLLVMSRLHHIPLLPLFFRVLLFGLASCFSSLSTSAVNVPFSFWVTVSLVIHSTNF